MNTEQFHAAGCLLAWSIRDHSDHRTLCIPPGQYNIDDWNTRIRLPAGWAAIVSMVFGLFGAYLGFAQAFTINSKTLVAIPGVSEAILFNVGSSYTWAITGPIGGLSILLTVWMWALNLPSSLLVSPT